MKVKFGIEEGPLQSAKFHPHQHNVSPLWGEKSQNHNAASNNNTKK